MFPADPIHPPARRPVLLAAAAGLLALLAPWARAQPRAAAPAPAAAIPVQRLQLVRGAARVHGRLQGPDGAVRDHLVRARAGQMLEVSLETKALGAAFNVLAPDRPEALFIGELSAAPRWRGRAPVDGDYRVRVFLNRLKASQGLGADYTLRVRLTRG